MLLHFHSCFLLSQVCLNQSTQRRKCLTFICSWIRHLEILTDLCTRAIQTFVTWGCSSHDLRLGLLHCDKILPRVITRICIWYSLLYRLKREKIKLNGIYSKPSRHSIIQQSLYQTIKCESIQHLLSHPNNLFSNVVKVVKRFELNILAQDVSLEPVR